MELDGDVDAVAAGEDGSRFDLSRRDFLGAVGVSALASAGLAASHTEFNDVRVDFNENIDPETDRPVLDIILIQRPVDGGPEDDVPFETAWRLPAQAFGPRARFILSHGRWGEPPWAVRVVDAGYGRLVRREFLFSFFIRSVDGLQRLTVEMHSNVLSLTTKPTTPQTVGYKAGRPRSMLREEELVFRDLVERETTEGQPVAEFWIDPAISRVESTMKLMFNGALTASGNGGRIYMRFGVNLAWTFEFPRGQIAALGGRVPITALRVFWPLGRGQEDGADEAPLYGEAQAIDAPEGEWTFAIGGEVGPVWHLRRSKDSVAPAPILLRAQPAPNDDREAAFRRGGGVETETVLVGDWTLERMDHGPDRTVGPLPELRGSLLERIPAPRQADDSDHAKRAGSLSFQARYVEEGQAGARTATPIGPLVTVPLGEVAEDSGEGPAFPERRDFPILAVWAWRAELKRSKRAKPQALFTEARLAVVHAGVPLSGADYSRLDMDDTEVRVFYAAEAPADPPLGSFIDQGAGEGREVARLDLSRARLRAGRGHELLSLTFRFSDLALTFRDGTGLPEMVSATPRCEVSTRPIAADSGVGVHDTRPVLVVEFPPQHLFEEVAFAPQPLPPPDVEVGRRLTVVKVTGNIRPGAEAEGPILYKDTGSEITFDPDNRAHVVDVIAALARRDDETPRPPWEDSRVMTFRVDLRQVKIDSAKGAQEGSPAARFERFAKKVEAELDKLRRSQKLPVEQTIYIGPFALDADAMGVVRAFWQEKFLDAQVESLIGSAFAAARQVRDGLEGAAPTTFDTALTQEVRIQGAVPIYVLFRDFYRDVMVRSFYTSVPELKTAKGAQSLDAEELEFVLAASERVQGGFVTADMIRRYSEIREAFLDFFKGGEPLEGPKRSRLSGPSRLAFRINCPDGIEAARATTPELDLPEDAEERLPVRPLKFDIGTLLTFRGMELSVTRRAEIVYEPGQLGQIGWRSARVADTTPAAMLRHLNFALDPGGVSVGQRLGDVAASLRRPTGLETAIEMPARLVLSPHQHAIVTTPNEAADAIFDLDIGEACASPTGPPEGATTRTLWSANFITGADGLGLDPGLRAVWSHDLRPGALLNRFADASRSNGDRVLAEGTPPSGPVAPWHIHRLDAETGGMSEEEINRITGVAACALETDRTTLARIVRDFCDRLAGRRPEPHASLRFRASLSARDRHEIVLSSSAFGLPVIDPRPGAATSEPEALLGLRDVRPGYASFHPGSMGVAEIGMTSLGGILVLDTGLATLNAAIHWRDGRPVFDATSVERYQHRIAIGRDVSVEVVYKGYLFPLGIRASLIKVTERVFWIDGSGAITAPLRQRIFIRVASPEKLYPAVRMPREGRRFPVDQLNLLTTTTPDIVDPWSDDPNPNPLPKPGGRLVLSGASKGLVFWPRVLKTVQGNIRFEMDLDGVKTTLPLIFADNMAISDPHTVRALVAYYNDPGRVPSPDRVAPEEPLPVVDPVTHLRTLVLAGADRRYAPEREAGSTTWQTEHWTLRATGGAFSEEREEEGTAFNPARYVFHTDEHEYDQVRLSADQPPFYPAIEVARIHLTQVERLVGRLLGPKRVTFDARYAQHGLPAIEEAEEDATPDEGAENRNRVLDSIVVPEPNPREVVLALLDEVRLRMGDKGDQSGGVFRPAGMVVGLSRLKGALTLADYSPSELPVVEDDAERPAFATTPDVLPDLAGLLLTSSENTQTTAQKRTPKAQAGASGAMQVAAPKKGSVLPVELEEVRDLYKKLFSRDTKILGLVSLPDLIDLVQQLAPPSEGMPELTELMEFAEAAGSSANTIRDEIVLPLSAAVSEVRKGWAAIDRDIAEELADVPGSGTAVVTVRDVFPELHAALLALEKALRDAASTPDPIEFAFALSACYAAGQRLLAEIKRAAADPIAAIEGAIANRFGSVLALFRALETGIEGMVVALLSEKLGELELTGEPGVIADKLADQVSAWMETAVWSSSAEELKLAIPAEADVSTLLRRNLIGLPQPAGNDTEQLKCFANFLPAQKDVEVVLKDFTRSYVRDVVAESIEGGTLPDPADRLDAWLSETAEIVFEGDPLDRTRTAVVAAAKDGLLAYIEPTFEGQIGGRLKAKATLVVARLEDPASPLFNGDSLRKGTRAQQIRLRYLLGVIDPFLTDPGMIEDCLPSEAPELLEALLDAMLWLAETTGDAETFIARMIGRALEAMLRPVLAVLRALARLIQGIRVGNLNTILAALQQLFGEVLLPLPDLNCTQVWTPVKAALDAIGTVLGQVRLCPKGWDGPLPGVAAEDFVIGAPEVPEGELTFCEALLYGAVQVRKLRVMVKDQDYIDALTALSGAITDTTAKGTITAMLDGVDEVQEILDELQSKLLDGYGAVLRDAAANRAVFVDLDKAKGLDPCTTTNLEALLGFVNLPRDVELLIARRKTLLETLREITVFAAEQIGKMEGMAEDGRLAVPILAGVDDWLLKIAPDYEPDGGLPLVLAGLEAELRAVRDAAQEVLDAADAAARDLAKFMCRQAELVREIATSVREAAGDIRKALNEAKAQLADLPPQARAVVARIEAAFDPDRVERLLDAVDAQSTEIEKAVEELCPPSDGPIPLAADADNRLLLSNLFEMTDGAATGPGGVFLDGDDTAPIQSLIEAGTTALGAATPVIDELRAIVEAGPQAALRRVLAPVAKALITEGITFKGSPFTNDDDRLSLSTLYDSILDARNEIIDAVVPANFPIGEDRFLVAPDDARGPLSGYEPPGQAVLTKQNDQLTGDVAWLKAAGDGELSNEEMVFLTEFVREWGAGTSTPIVILRQVGSLIEDLFSGRIFQHIDFAALRRQFEDQLLALVPTKVTMSYDFDIRLGEEVAAATMGIFRPGPDTALTIDTSISMNLAALVRGEGGPPPVQFGSVGTLGPFNIKLVGDVFDAITLRFSSARFESQGGNKSRFDIGYIGHEIGPELEFLEDLQRYLAPKDGSGAILNFNERLPGFEAGYRLQLGAFSVGNLAFSNVGLEASAILPFSDRDAVFKSSLSSRTSPFTLTYAPFGGSGFFAIYANTAGIIGFEAGFEFGGSAVFAFGPLTGEGRLMSGVYIAQFEVQGAILTELSMTFVAEGSAAIWIFSFGASLHVKLGQKSGGQMTGEATFAFSFSMGIADYSYSVTVSKNEDKGFNGQTSAGPSRTRFAALDEDEDLIGRRNPYGACIENETICQTANWNGYQAYFDDILPPEEFFVAGD